EAHRDELSTIALDPLQKPGSAVARRALVAFDSSPLHIRRICASILRPDRSAPDSRDHSAATARRYRLKTNPPAARRTSSGAWILGCRSSTPPGLRRPGMMPG